MVVLNTNFFALGNIGNFLIIFTIWKDFKKSLTCFLLVNLAVSDIFVLTSSWIFQTRTIIARNSDVMRFVLKHTDYFLKIYQAILYTF